MVDAVSETTSLLRQMAGEIKERKGVTLTPNILEGKADALDVGAPFPYDKPAQDILAAFGRIEVEMDFIRKALGWVRNPPVTVRTDKTERPIIKEGEVLTVDPVVDEQAFEKSLAAKSAAAQAEVFKIVPTGVPGVATYGGMTIGSTATPLLKSTWKCPVHGSVEVKVNKAGREYMTCPLQCGEFEVFS